MERDTTENGKLQSNTTGTVREQGRLSRLLAPLATLADKGSGFDRDVLHQHGSDQDKTKSRAVGSVNIAASSVGAAGAFVKVFMIVPGPMAVPAALFLAVTYWVIVFNIERILAIGVNPLMTAKSKVLAAAGRSLITLVTASFQALPWAAIALHGQVETKLEAFTISERVAYREKLSSLHGVEALKSSAAKLDRALNEAQKELTSQPEYVIDARQLADKCNKDVDLLLATNRTRALSLSNRLVPLANIILSPTSTEAQKDKAKVDRASIDQRIRKLADDVSAKRTECQRAESAATDAKTKHVAEATAGRNKAITDINAHKEKEASIEKELTDDLKKADGVSIRSNQANTSAEAKALYTIVVEEPWARFVAASIWLFFFIIDLSPISLKLLLKPGPYDEAMQLIGQLSKITQVKQLREAENEEAVASAVSNAKRHGVETFHAEDAGAVFSRHEKLHYEEDILAREELRDIRVAAIELEAIERLAVQVESLWKKTEHQPALHARLKAALNALRGPQLETQAT